MRKRYNFFLNVCFFTRFALIPCRVPCETSENIDTDLADAMDRHSLWVNSTQDKSG